MFSGDQYLGDQSSKLPETPILKWGLRVPLERILRDTIIMRKKMDLVGYGLTGLCIAATASYH